MFEEKPSGMEASERKVHCSYEGEEGCFDVGDEEEELTRTNIMDNNTWDSLKWKKCGQGKC